MRRAAAALLSRRAFVGRAVGATAAAVLGVAGIATLLRGEYTGAAPKKLASSNTPAPARSRRRPRRTTPRRRHNRPSLPAGAVPIAASSALAPGQGGTYSDPGDGQPDLVIRQSSGSLKAMSAICTHAGCQVRLRARGGPNAPATDRSSTPRPAQSYRAPPCRRSRCARWSSTRGRSTPCRHDGSTCGQRAALGRLHIGFARGDRGCGVRCGRLWRERRADDRRDREGHCRRRAGTRASRGPADAPRRAPARWPRCPRRSRTRRSRGWAAPSMPPAASRRPTPPRPPSAPFRPPRPWTGAVAGAPPAAGPRRGSRTESGCGRAVRRRSGRRHRRDRARRTRCSAQHRPPAQAALRQWRRRGRPHRLRRRRMGRHHAQRRHLPLQGQRDALVGGEAAARPALRRRGHARRQAAARRRRGRDGRPDARHLVLRPGQRTGGPRRRAAEAARPRRGRCRGQPPVRPRRPAGRQSYRDDPLLGAGRAARAPRRPPPRAALRRGRSRRARRGRGGRRADGVRPRGPGTPAAPARAARTGQDGRRDLAATPLAHGASTAASDPVARLGLRPVPITARLPGYLHDRRPRQQPDHRRQPGQADRVALPPVGALARPDRSRARRRLPDSRPAFDHHQRGVLRPGRDRLA